MARQRSAKPCTAVRIRSEPLKPTLTLVSGFFMAFYEKRFFIETPTLEIAEKLVGSRLHRKIEGQHLIVEITETEAYLEKDKACHAYQGKKTNRTKLMFEPGASVYTYLCYGIHTLFNTTCGPQEKAEAVLIRAAKIIEGEAFIRVNRNSPLLTKDKLLSGPGNFAKGLGFSLEDYGISITSEDLFMESRVDNYPHKVIKTRRLGVEYAGEDATLPYRFYEENAPSVSKPDKY